MTREELKKILASKPNRLAASAIEAIKARSPLETLKEIVESGAADRHYYRDPVHPRSKYRVEHVLDACFDSSFGVVSEKSTTSPSGLVSKGFVLGHIPASSGTSAHFEYLLDRGFSPGTNGYRGDLFGAIMKGCFYRDPSESSVAKDLATILVRKGLVDIQKFAESNYEWTGSEDKLRKVMELGALPTPGMLDCALRYCACAQYQGDPKTGRADVIRILLDAGVLPSKPLGNSGSSKDQVSFLVAAGLHERIASPARSLSLASIPPRKAQVAQPQPSC